jgi:hypothetical protein
LVDHNLNAKTANIMVIATVDESSPSVVVLSAAVVAVSSLSVASVGLSAGSSSFSPSSTTGAAGVTHFPSVPLSFVPATTSATPAAPSQH